jgi:hypothetical protein
VKKLKLLSCKKLFLILDRNDTRFAKAKAHKIVETASKILNKNLLKQIEMEVLKLADQVIKEKEREK